MNLIYTFFLAAASIFTLIPNALTSQKYASPSAFNKGYIDNHNCPVMLGKGFGPPAYKDLCDVWKNISSELRFSEQDVKNVKRLISRMSAFDRYYSREEVLSGIISSSCQLIFRSYGEENLIFEHQLSSTQKDEPWFIDIAITNGGDPDKFYRCQIHTLGEVKWDFSMDEFPEMQATAVADSMWKSGTLHLPWVPIFVLSQSHFSFGVAFNFYDVRWSYSEICEYHESSRFSLKSENDVMMLCRFSRFMLAAALHHARLSSSVTAEHKICPLVDMTGAIIFKYMPFIIGDRVLCGMHQEEANTIIKFYPDKASAESEVGRKRQIEIALGLAGTDCPIIQGCGGGFCAVQFKRIVSVAKISIDHLKCLTKLVSKLFTSQLVHGDLRLPNIIFIEDGKVVLIDFEWAGSFYTARFPDTVSREAFGKNAQGVISPSGLISRDFDWRCLADIFECFGNDGLVGAACACNEDDVLAILDSEKENVQALSKLVVRSRPRSYIYFGRFSSRIGAYFHKHRRMVSGGGKSKKRRRMASAESAKSQLRIDSHS